MSTVEKLCASFREWTLVDGLLDRDLLLVPFIYPFLLLASRVAFQLLWTFSLGLSLD